MLIDLKYIFLLLFRHYFFALWCQVNSLPIINNIIKPILLEHAQLWIGICYFPKKYISKDVSFLGFIIPLNNVHFHHRNPDEVTIHKVCIDLYPQNGIHFLIVDILETDQTVVMQSDLFVYVIGVCSVSEFEFKELVDWLYLVTAFVFVDDCIIVSDFYNGD